MHDNQHITTTLEREAAALLDAIRHIPGLDRELTRRLTTDTRSTATVIAF